uniref:MYND-type domain-containing protein n=1 Tax=Entomoneis paludosa TaxID=265537 RepID=A0A7S3DSB8_9STRA|mmetsp:Transcript_31495/g.65768  ORF Transcript_31495/g.65768 Transcript_31495/m.65768 type:complete len:427 (+) Transcript_31495:189-1469(+)
MAATFDYRSSNNNSNNMNINSSTGNSQSGQMARDERTVEAATAMMMVRHDRRQTNGTHPRDNQNRMSMVVSPHDSAPHVPQPNNGASNKIGSNGSNNDKSKFRPCFVLWRDFQGQRIYTGIVVVLDEQEYKQETAIGTPGVIATTTTTLYKKLDDPYGGDAVFGSGHLMSHMEYLTESCHYSEEFQDHEMPFMSRKMKEIKAAITNFDDFLIDFHVRPPHFVDREENTEFDIKYPFGTVANTAISKNNNNASLSESFIPQVRALDAVKVVARGFVHPGNSSHVERFWVTVQSVTIFGMVTGKVNHDLHYFPLKQHDLVSFSLTRILGVKRGPNWIKDDCCANCQTPSPAAAARRGNKNAPRVLRGAPLMACHGCFRAHYCSVDCQLKHWDSEHHRFCDHTTKHYHHLLCLQTQAKMAGTHSNKDGL